VSLVHLSDPGIITSEGQQPASGEVPPVAPTIPASPAGGIGGGGAGVGTPGGIFAVGAAGATEPDVPAALAERLVRTGYIKIGKGLFRHDLYVGADQIDRVSDDRVILMTAKDHLIKEA
jgi:hypothetical protein